MKTGYHKRGRCARDISGPGTGGISLSQKKLEKRCWQKREGVVFYQSCPRDSGYDNEIPWMRERNRLEKFEKSSWQGKRDVVPYTSRLRGRHEIRERPAGLAESWKSLKKLEKSSWQSWHGVVKWTPAAAMRCAPCTLTNVTNTKHQIWICLFEHA